MYAFRTAARADELLSSCQRVGGRARGRAVPPLEDRFVRSRLRTAPWSSAVLDCGNGKHERPRSGPDREVLALLLVAAVHGAGAPWFCAVLDCGNGYCCGTARFVRTAPAAAFAPAPAAPAACALPRVEALEPVRDGPDWSLSFTLNIKFCNLKG